MKHPARTILILLTLLTPLPGMTQTLLSSEIIRFGGRFEERAQGMDVDAGGNIFITGHTMSDNLPCVGTLNPNHHNPMASHQYDQWLHSDGYVAKLGPDGATVLWCTYLGGTDQDRAYNLKVDATGIYVAGITDSDDFDGSGGQITSGHAVFITKLSLDGTQVLFTTLIDGPGNEWMRNAMALSGGSLYVSGFTESDNLQGHPSLGGRDGFVARLDTGTGQIQALRRCGRLRQRHRLVGCGRGPGGRRVRGRPQRIQRPGFLLPARRPGRHHAPASLRRVTIPVPGTGPGTPSSSSSPPICPRSRPPPTSADPAARTPP